MTPKENRRIALIAPYFGPLPDWFTLFIETASNNKDYQFLIYTDQEFSEHDRNENIIFIRCDLQFLSRKVSDIIGIDVNIENPYKICDLKPMFGHIFGNDIIGYEYWGHIDIDIFFGRLGIFINEKVLNNDIITTHKNLISGPFTLYRNVDFINLLYRRVPHFVDILSDMKSYREFDEVLFSSIVSQAEFNGEINVYRDVGSHGHSESNSKYIYYKGKILKERRIKSKIIVDDNLNLLPVLSNILYVEKIFFHFRAWKGGLSFEFDPKSVSGWTIRPDRLKPII